MALWNLTGWNRKNAAAPTTACGTACGAGDKPEAPAPTACGAGDRSTEPQPTACGTGCGAGDK